MSEAEIWQPRLSSLEDDEVVRYQAVSHLAVVGVIAGLLAAVALIHPLLWIVPVAGIFLCVLALRRIAREAPALIGRKVALVGLVLSVFWGTVAPSQWFAYRRLIDVEARQFTAGWFDLLLHNEPHKAYRLTHDPRQRGSLDENRPAPNPGDFPVRDERELWLSRSEVVALVALGDRARVRYYDTERQWREQGRDAISQVYAVTYEEAGGRKSFFIRLVLERHHLSSTGRADWQISSTTGGIRPKEWRVESGEW